MRRRTRKQGPFSLFAFQDVMMTVMGIMLLLTLLLLLELTETVGDIVAKDPADAAERQTVDAADVEARRREVERLQREFERTAAALDRLSTSLPEAHEQREALAAELTELLAELDRSALEVEQVREAVDAAEIEHVEDLQRLGELHEQIEQARAALDRHRRNPRLTYRLDPGLDRTPILVELDGERIGIAPHDQPDFGIWLSGEGFDRRLANLLAFARSRSASEDYFVLLVKPSAFDDYRAVRDALADAGFRVGTEIIEEHVAAVAPLPGERPDRPDRPERPREGGR